MEAKVETLVFTLLFGFPGAVHPKLAAQGKE